MIKFYQVIDPRSSLKWTIGQFPNEKAALNEYNSEVRSSRSEGIDDGRPQLLFADHNALVEYYLTEQEISHTETRRDEAIETGRWGLVRETQQQQSEL